MNPDTRKRYHELQARIVTVCAGMGAELARLGLLDEISAPDAASAEYSLARDPASGKDTLTGVWRDARGHKRGEILMHADGSFFAEYDVVVPHPRDPRWFVEAVTAWGKDSVLKSEPRLLPAIQDT